MSKRYRIRAVGVNKWYVEHLQYQTIWEEDISFFGNSKMKSEVAEYWLSVKAPGSLYVPRTFFSEEEAEAYIQKRIEIDESWEREKKKDEDFIAANPPREVPPFKFYGR